MYGTSRRRNMSAAVCFSRVKMAASSGGEMIGYEEGALERPKWSGETPLSRLVQALISFKPLYSILKFGARQVFIRFIKVTSRVSPYIWSYCVCIFIVLLYVLVNSTAEKKNIPWREMTREILDSDVYKLMDDIQDPSLIYPDCNISLILITFF